jgi:hypothetical protein
LAGNLYVTDANANKLYKFTSDGVGSVVASGGLNQLIGLAFNSMGNLYAANQGNGTIEKFTRGGLGVVFASTSVISPQHLAFTENERVPLKLPNQRGIPEPGSWTLLGFGLTPFIGRARRAAGRRFDRSKYGPHNADRFPFPKPKRP